MSKQHSFQLPEEIHQHVLLGRSPSQLRGSIGNLLFALLTDCKEIELEVFQEDFKDLKLIYDFLDHLEPPDPKE